MLYSTAQLLDHSSAVRGSRGPVVSVLYYKEKGRANDPALWEIKKIPKSSTAIKT